MKVSRLLNTEDKIYI